MSPADDLDDHEEEGAAEDYLQRLASEMDTIKSKVHLKIAKLYRQCAWIFAVGKSPSPTLRRNIRQAMATSIMVMRTAPKIRDYPTTDAWERAVEAWGNQAECEHGHKLMGLVASLQAHFEDETTAPCQFSLCQRRVRVAIYKSVPPLPPGRSDAK